MLLIQEPLFLHDFSLKDEGSSHSGSSFVMYEPHCEKTGLWGV